MSSVEIVITPGSLGGIGTEITQRLLASPVSDDRVRVFAVKSEWDKVATALHTPKLSPHVTLDFEPTSFPEALARRSGFPAPYSQPFQQLVRAMDYVSQDPARRALVTGPMRKSDFPGATVIGHTESLMSFFAVPDVSMLFISGKTMMIPLTRHIPLHLVPSRLTDQTFRSVFTHLENSKGALGKPARELRIAVTGLNPHAGEGGRLGTEEKTWMAPLLDDYRRQGWTITGPISADTAMVPENLLKYDLFLSAYHDQLLPTFKALFFSQSCQCTLGLPIVRTSVDHGTADDLYLSGRADVGGLKTAIHTAASQLKNLQAH